MTILNWIFIALLIPAVIILGKALFWGYPEYQSLVAGEMKVTAIKSYTTSNGSRLYAEGIIVNKKEKVVKLNFLKKAATQLGIATDELQTVLIDGGATISVWFSHNEAVRLRTPNEVIKPSYLHFYGGSLLIAVALFAPYFFLLLYRKLKTSTLVLIGIVLAGPAEIIAQNREESFGFENAETLPISLSENTIVETSFLVYPDSTLVKGVFKNISDISLEMPEHVLEAMMSATSADWEKEFTYQYTKSAIEKSSKHYASVRNRKVNGAHFQLIYKLAYLDRSTADEYAYIRFRFINPNQNVNIVGLKRMVKNGDRWLLDPKSIDLGVAFSLSTLKISYLEKLLFEPEAISIEYAKYSSDLYTDNKLDLTKLGFNFMLWQQDQSKNKEFLNNITDNPGW